MSNESLDREYAQMLEWLEAKAASITVRDRSYCPGSNWLLQWDNLHVFAGSLVGAVRKAWELEDFGHE